MRNVFLGKARLIQGKEIFRSKLLKKSRWYICPHPPVSVEYQRKYALSKNPTREFGIASLTQLKYLKESNLFRGTAFLSQSEQLFQSFAWLKKQRAFKKSTSFLNIQIG